MRFFFNVRDRLEIEDALGREFPGIPQAVDFARQLAADIRCLEPTVRPALAIDVIKETAERVHREAVSPDPRLAAMNGSCVSRVPIAPAGRPSMW